MRQGAFLAALVLFAACANGTTTVLPGTGVEILVLKGPIQPVEREGEVNVAPVEGAVIVARRASGGVAAILVTDAEGRAREALAPGRYTLVVDSCPGALWPPADVPITIESGAFAEVRLDCDTGIR